MCTMQAAQCITTTNRKPAAGHEPRVDPSPYLTSVKTGLTISSRAAEEDVCVSLSNKDSHTDQMAGGNLVRDHRTQTCVQLLFHV